MSEQPFAPLIAEIANWIGDRNADRQLMADLNRQFPADSAIFRNVRAAIEREVAAGRMCQHEAGGIRYGRVIKPGNETGRFSVDVVLMKDIAGPHHRHPNGEIDMIMPIDPNAQFDGHGAGWLVYGPDSAHRPTVSGGEAYVLYLLPEGAIEFTKN